MNWVLKEYSELSIDELYAILRIRCEVFVVEQNCVYQDLDNEDQNAQHLFSMDDNECLAYCRLFAPNLKYPNSSSIGRVVVAANKRRNSLGQKMMEKAIFILKEQYPQSPITISAQKYSDEFYQNLGFLPKGESYMEDGIPHQKMVKP